MTGWKKQSRQFGVFALFVLTTAAAGSFAIIRLPLPLIAKMLIIQTIGRLFFRWRCGIASTLIREYSESFTTSVLLSLMPGVIGGVAFLVFSIAALSEDHRAIIPMRYRLRTLLILLAIGPPMLATMWFWPNGGSCALIGSNGSVLRLVVRMLVSHKRTPKCAASRTIPDQHGGLSHVPFHDPRRAVVDRSCRASGSHS